MNNRIQTADLLKGIAVLLMVQVHILELFATPQISTGYIGKFLLFLGGPFVAPVFAFFLGYFIANSQKTKQQLIKRGVGVFFLGIGLNLTLNLNLILSVKAGKFTIDLLPYIFGADILPFAGLAIIILAGFKNRNVYLIITLAVVSALLGHFCLRFVTENISLKYISSFVYGSNWWSYFPLFPWLAYPLMGLAFYKLKQQFNIGKLYSSLPQIMVMLSFFLFMAFTIFYAVSISSNLQAYYHHGLLFFLWTVIFLMFYSFFVNQLNILLGNFIGIKYIEWLGKNVTLIYVIQWIMIGNYATEVYKTITSPAYLISSFIIVLLVASLLAYLLLAIKNKAAIKAF